MLTLQVFIAHDCWSCAESAQIVRDVSQAVPNLIVELLDVEQIAEKPETVFAVPTYLLNGRIISLGNPTREELRQKLLSATSTW